jgi:HprK-related kinase A
MNPLLSSLGLHGCRGALRSPAGLGLQLGPFAVRLRTALADVATGVARLYANYPLADPSGFFDFQVAVKRASGLRRFWHPQVGFEFEGEQPFNPLPGNQGLPLLEWGLNWCVYSTCHQYLILHAAVLERGGRALILPSPSGSGKSTLCAALLFSGWRLLSDELTLISPADGCIVPHPRPVSLKNESIDVIRAYAPQVQFGSSVADTVKGRVAHFAAPADAVAQRGNRALPGWVVMPKYRAGQTAALQPVERARAFMHLVENAFNYDVFGTEGFQLLGTVIDRSTCFSFEYSDIHEAVALFDRLAAGDTQATV